VQVAQLQDLFKIGTDHSFRVMGEYRYNTLQSPGLIGSGADVFYSVFAGSAMWNWAITPKWELTNAVRVDTLKLGRSGGSLVVPFTSNEDFDHRTTAVSENTGLVWKATDADTLRASFARGIQAPSLISSGLALSLFGGAVTDVGQPTLNPAVVTNYELGYDRAISAINGKFRSDVYYKRTQDVFEIGTTAFLSGPTTVQQAGNIGNTHTEGAELGLSGKFLQDWSWDASYAYQTTNDNFSVNTIAFTVPTNFQDTFPHHIVNAHIGWAKGPWEADLYGQADSSFKAISNTAVAGTYKLVNLNRFGTVSARVAYTLDPGITVALSGLDVSQTSTATNAGLEEERQVFLSLSKKF
jgi:iron complex outermembrane receptor protein